MINDVNSKSSIYMLKNDYSTIPLFANCQQKKEFKEYLKQVKPRSFYSREFLNHKLNILVRSIELLFEKKFDGTLNGMAGPHCFEAFAFSATSRINWEIEYMFNLQDLTCFLPQHKNDAFNILKTFLSIRFENQINNIQRDGEKISIAWKS